jgi:Uma2 family endonuclease
VSPDYGGQCTVDARDYLHGGPEMVVEVSASTVARDYGRKLGVYLRHNVRELLIWRTREGVFDWFALHGVDYKLQKPDPNGVLRSEGFPGLWLHLESILSGNLAPVLAHLQHGIDSDMHRDFIDRLGTRRTV